MRIFTSYFANIKEVSSQGLTPIGIAIFPPKFYYGLHYKTLAPSPKILKWQPEAYTKYYNNKLIHLDAGKVVEELAVLSGGKDICLLCYEAPDKFCHRHLVAKWLMKNTDLIIQEVVKEGAVQTSLFD